MPLEPGPVGPNCTACGGAVASLGAIPVRKGGASGGRIFFFGNLAEAGETVVRLDTYRCTKCRHLEFYDHDTSLPQR